MNRLVKIVIGIAIVIIVPKIVQKVMFSETPSDIVSKMAKDMNIGLPKKIDTVTTLTKVDFENDVYRIHYTLDRGTVADPSKLDSYSQYAIKQICAGNMKVILVNKIAIEYLYTYQDAGGREQHMTVPIAPGSCT